MAFEYVIGYPTFTLSCSFVGDDVRFGCLLSRNDRSFVDIFGGDGVSKGIGEVLSSLIQRWHSLFSPFSSGTLAGFEIGFDDLFGVRPIVPVVFMRKGKFISIKCDNDLVEMGPESVCLAEIFLGFGNLLATHAEKTLADNWRSTVSDTDLPPFAALTSAMTYETPIEDAPETAWYAKAVGQSLDDYLRAARWLSARQLAFAARLEGYGEPTKDDYDVTRLPAELPGEAEVSQLVSKAATAIGIEVQDVIEQGVVTRNMDVRQLRVFRKHYPR